MSRSMIRNMYPMHRSDSPVSDIRQLVRLSIDEHAGRTYAKAELFWGGSHLAGQGVAYRHPCDHLAREAGRELATARALSDLAKQVTAPRRVRA
jgi:hypothetical protein